MLWNEFVEGTNCRDNEYNFKVYKDLEVLYMNYDAMTKEEVYKLGKKLVDNSPSEEELRLIRETQEAIADCEERIVCIQKSIRYMEEAAELWKARGDEEFAKECLDKTKPSKKRVRELKAEIKRLKLIIR